MGKWTIDGKLKKKGEKEEKKPGAVFDDKEVSLFKEAFEAFQNEDGNMPTSLVATALRAMGQCPTEMDIHETIIKVDKDRNGKIDFDEFLDLIGGFTNQEKSTEDICDAFAVFDDNNNGVIDMEELRHALTNLGDKLTDEEMNELIKMADTRNDGRIRYKAFVENVEGKKKKVKRK